MSVEIKTPQLPESVADALIVKWFKKAGEPVQQDEPIIEIETDKVVLEVPAPVTGVIESIVEGEDSTVVSDQLLGTIAEGAIASAPAEVAPTETTTEAAPATQAGGQTSPAVRKALDEKRLSAGDVTGSGKNGRILKEDVTATGNASAPAARTETAPAPVGERIEERVPMTRLRKRIENF